MKNLTKHFLCLIVFSSICTFAYSQNIRGNISGDNGEPLIGASVLVQGTTTGTVTDNDGNFSITASNGDILLISYIGYKTVTATVEEGASYNFTLSENSALLDDIVVTATRQPVRKIQTTTAITSVGIEELQSIQPESVAEALVAVPGVTVENSQGRKSSYNIRGFPSGNTYVTTLLDGLPLSGFASRSAGTAEFHGLDKNIGRVEVVRGSGATLFGRAAGAGAVNLISKTGGDEFGGMVSVTNMNNVAGEGHPFEGDFNYRADFNFNGPITDELRYSIGGFFMEDAGIKEWAVKDKGTQFSGNLEYTINDNTKIRLYGMWGNNQYNNLTDAPYDLADQSLPDGWTNANTFYPDNTQLDFVDTLKSSAFAPPAFQVPVLDTDGNKILQNQAEDNREEVIGGMIGLSATIGITENLSLIEKIRFQAFDWRDHNEITFSSFYNVNSNILRLNANSVGQISDIVNETRLQYTIDGASRHVISAGVYYSDAKYDRFGGLHWYTANVSPRPTYGWFGPPGTPPPRTFSLSSTTSHQEENVLGIFVGDEMVFNEKLSVNVGFRFDQMTGFFNNDPEQELDGVSFDPAELMSNEIDFSDFSGSIGANYLLTDRSAIYGSFVRAFSLPTVGLATLDPEEFDDYENEIVINAELGYRFGVGDLSADLAVFSTTINNRLATVFDPQAASGQTFVQKSVGTNNILGGELQLTYVPEQVKGLLIRGSLTLQQSQYDGLEISLDNIDHDMDETTPMIPEADLDNLFGLDLVNKDADLNIYTIDVSGNQVQNTPTMILAFNAGYTGKYFGAGFDMAHYAGRYATALNLYETPNLTIANANLYGKYPLANGSAIRLGIRIKNLLDSANPQQLVLGSTNDDILVQKQATPDFVTADDGNVFGFGILQTPRRILITLGYDF